MKNLLAKEQILYNAVTNSPSDKDFFIGFHAYFLYILSTGDQLLIDHIAEQFLSRMEEEKSIEAIKTEIIENATQLLNQLFWKY